MRKKASAIFSSIDSIKKNPIIFIPDILLFLLIYGLTILFYKYNNLAKLLSMLMSAESRAEIIKTFFVQNWLQLVISFAVFFFISFILGVGMEAIRFSMIKQIIKKKKASLKKAWKLKNKFFWKIVLMKILVTAILFISLLLLLIIAILIMAICSTIGVYSILWLASLASIFLLIMLTLALLFRYAALFLDNKGTVKAIKGSFKYFSKNKKHTFFVWLTITIVSLIFGTLATSASLWIGKLQNIVNIALWSYVIMFFSSFTAFLIRTIYTIWSQVFIFKNYKN